MGSATGVLEERSAAKGLYRIAAIDALAVVGTVLAGTASHGTNPLTEPVGALETAVPFLIGWLFVAGLSDAYDPETLADPVRTARLTTVAWFGAANVGLVLRSSPFFDGGVAWPFGAVITGSVLLALLAWRLGYAKLVA